MALFSESLRFIDLEKWVPEILTSGIKLHIPLKFTALFNKWGNMSTILHKGRAAHEAGAIHDDKITDEEIIKQWSSYDSICSILGSGIGVAQEELQIDDAAGSENKRKLLCA
jgi:hypothetical protein